MRNKILLFLVIFIIILGALGYWFYQRNTYSKEVLRLEIFGPQTALIGEEIEYSIRLKNNGDVRLDDPQLLFEFPAFSQPSQGETLRVTKEAQDLGGSIYPGQEKIFRFKTRLFGEQGQTQEAKAMVSYRPKDLKAKYVSQTSCLTTIGEAPLTFEFDVPSAVGSSQEMNFSLNYFSSVNYPLSDLEIKTDYPAGFELKETYPKGISNNEWRLTSLNKAEGGKINIKGTLKGETGESKTFKAELGIWRGGDFVVLKQTTKQVKIIEPSLYISQTINNAADYVAKPGDLLHYQISFRNLGNSPLQNLFLAVKLNGGLFDLQTIRSADGQSQAGDNSIIWDWHNIPKLQFLDIDEEGEVEFWVKLQEGNGEIIKPNLEDEIILGQTRRKFAIKVNSKLELAQNVFIDDEIFGSQGNLPPRVGQESMFTVIWKIKNFYNPLKDVKLSAILAPEAKLTGQVVPQKLSFDPATRELVWVVDGIEANQGIKDPFQLAFQIVLTPTVSQRGSFAPLIGALTMKGLDEWTEEDITATSTPATTEVFGAEQGRVQ